jgi:hypothetical protein
MNTERRLPQNRIRFVLGPLASPQTPMRSIHRRSHECPSAAPPQPKVGVRSCLPCRSLGEGWSRPSKGRSKPAPLREPVISGSVLFVASCRNGLAFRPSRVPAFPPSPVPPVRRFGLGCASAAPGIVRPSPIRGRSRTDETQDMHKFGQNMRRSFSPPAVTFRPAITALQFPPA